MFDRVLAEIPTHIWEENRPNDRVWDAEYSVAGWIRVLGANGGISLLVRHEDEAGVHVAVVDRHNVTDTSNNLMSGLIGARTTGKIIKAQVVLQISDPGMRFHVEELFVQRNGSAARQENKLISKR